MDLKKELAGKSSEFIQEHLNTLHEYRKISLKRAKIADSKAVQIHLEELEIRLAEVRRRYLEINVKIHPSTVVATLASLQGQEVEILDQMRVSWQESLAMVTKPSLDWQRLTEN
jgi:hypothetical protein